MEETIRICQRAQMNFPDNPDFYFYEGMAYYQLKDYDKALAVYHKGESVVDPKDTKLLSDFHGQIGDLYYHLGDKKKAYEHYDTALQYNDKNIGVMNNYAYFLTLDKSDLSKAERLSAQCVQVQPDNSTFIDTYAWVFFVKEYYSLAKFYIESALSKGGDKSSEIVDHYGDILYMSGEKEKAVEQWKKALEMGKDTEIIRKKITDETYYEDTNAK
jgi:Putative Zn-dependent protease, contains TPR repeats